MKIALVQDWFVVNGGAEKVVKEIVHLYPEADIFSLVDFLSAEDRKDIAQDVYLKAFKNLVGFKFQSKLSTWIAQIAYNTCINFLEKKKLMYS